MQFGHYDLDPLRHVLRSPQGEVQLSPLAGRLLLVLARQPGAIVERSVIIEQLWRGDWLVGDPALNRLVSELRRAVGDDPRNPTLIQTVPRLGYRLALVAEVGATGVVAPQLTAPSSQPAWLKFWNMVNVTVGILVAGTVLILVLSIAARYLR